MSQITREEVLEKKRVRYHRAGKEHKSKIITELGNREAPVAESLNATTRVSRRKAPKETRAEGAGNTFMPTSFVLKNGLNLGNNLFELPDPFPAAPG